MDRRIEAYYPARLTERGMSNTAIVVSLIKDVFIVFCGGVIGYCVAALREHEVAVRRRSSKPSEDG